MYICVCKCIYEECKPKLIPMGCRVKFGEQRGRGLKCMGLLSIQDLRSSPSRILLAAPFSNVTVSVRTPWTTIPKQHNDTTTMLLTSTAFFSFLSAFSLLFPIVSPKDDAFPANGLAFYKHHQLVIPSTIY